MSRKIIVDTREKIPWKFSKKDWPFGILKATLKTGDYSLEGLEDKFTIDRKGRVSELACNLLQNRFIRELERMHEMDHPYIVCDFLEEELLAYPYIKSIPKFVQKKIRAKGPFLIKILESLKEKYNIQWIFNEKGESQKEALSIIKDMSNKYV